MIRIIVLLVISLLTQNVISQTINSYSEPSTNHKLIKGTNIYLIPPKDFIESANFKGYQNPNSQTSIIMIMEIPGPFGEVSKGFNAEMLSSKGMKLIGKNEILISEYNGIEIDIEQVANGLTYSKHIIIYGNDKSTTMINGIFLKSDKENEKVIKESIQTTYVNTKIKKNPRKTTDYAIDESAGKMIFTEFVANSMFFNRDGNLPTESDDKTTLIVSKSITNYLIENKKLFCTSRMGSLPNKYELIQENGVNEIEIDELKGYELYAKNNENEFLYQVILFQEKGGYYIFIGTYDKVNVIHDIKAIIHTFKRKQ